jgi:2-C-methyl-D-erythritol 4-phosphate cytidylyltransferase
VKPDNNDSIDFAVRTTDTIIKIIIDGIICEILDHQNLMNGQTPNVLNSH